MSVLPQKPTSTGTRLAHACLAVAIVIQLASSLGMEPVEPRHAGNLLYDVHRFGGLAALLAVFGFWLVIVLRRVGTAPGLMFAWLNAPGRAALRSDIRAHLDAVREFRLPPYHEDSPLAAVVHGLGLLLMSAMALTGGLYFLIGGADPDAGGIVGVLMGLHTTLASLVWIYLIAHAAVAVLHHVAGQMDLRSIWSLRGTSSHTDRT